MAMSDIEAMISDIDNTENINLKKIIKNFEKRLHKLFKLYENNYGLEDYKMSDLDYIILHTIWKKINLPGNIETYLLIIYCYYKIEDIYFPIKKFKCDKIYDIIINTDIIKIINFFIDI